MLPRRLSTIRPRSSPTRLVPPLATKLKNSDSRRVAGLDPCLSPTPTMPFPTSPRSLYRNLLFLTSNSPFPISRAIEYYFDWPRALHSTNSFNLLISIALQSTSFATVRRLFSAMRAESVPPNMETWKLHVRWLIRTGRWNEAWQYVLELRGRQNVATPKGPIPLPLWLELFGSQKRGALRQWALTDRRPARSATDRGLDSVVPGAGLKGGRETMSADDGPLPRKRLMPRPSQKPYAVELSRYQALMQVSPLLTSSDQVQILPRTILIITRIMYQVGQGSLALSTALSYLKSLPPRIRRCDRRRLVDLVNFHISMAPRHRKQGLKRHFAQRRILWKCLHARTDLVPSPATLFLLLGPLRGCRRGGTLAMQCLHLFEKRWGPRVQSGLVRRRIASLALKEGRLDIVEAMIRLEGRWRVFGSTLRRAIYASRRKPWRTLFCRRGVENRRWHSIEEKYRSRLTRKPIGCNLPALDS